MSRAFAHVAPNEHPLRGLYRDKGAVSWVCGYGEAKHGYKSGDAARNAHSEHAGTADRTLVGSYEDEPEDGGEAA